MSRNLKIRRALFYIAILAAAAYLSPWLLLIKYWIVPAMTSLAFILYVRSLAEHHGAHVTDGYFRGLRLECLGPGAQA